MHTIDIRKKAQRIDLFTSKYKIHWIYWQSQLYDLGYTLT